jgi:hypothetical protein
MYYKRRQTTEEYSPHEMESIPLAKKFFFLGPMPCLFLLTYCCILFERMLGMNYALRDKLIKLGISEKTIRDTVSICWSISLSSSFEKNITYFPVTFSFADVDFSYYSVIKIIVRQLLDIHTKSCIYEVSQLEIPLPLTAFKVPLKPLKHALCTQLPVQQKLL